MFIADKSNGTSIVVLLFITDSTRASTLIFFLAGPGWNNAITILHQHVPCFYQSSHNLMIPVFWGTEMFQSMIKWGITNGGELLIFSSGTVFSKRLTNWARRTYWGWWDEWDDTVLQTQDSSPGGLRPSTLPLGHGGSPQYWVLHVDGEETLFFLLNSRDREPSPELQRSQYYTPYVSTVWSIVHKQELVDAETAPTKHKTFV